MTSIVDMALQQIAPKAQLQPQMWIDTTGASIEHGLTAAGLRPVRTGDDGHPRGGFWTSTYRPGTQDSAYVQFLRDMAPRGQQLAAWLLMPKRCRVWEIQNSQARYDTRILEQLATDESEGLWQYASTVMDAVHMTESGAASFLQTPPMEGGGELLSLRMHEATRIPSDHPLDWWDTESTFWMQWVFSSVKRLPDIVV